MLLLLLLLLCMGKMEALASVDTLFCLPCRSPCFCVLRATKIVTAVNWRLLSDFIEKSNNISDFPRRNQFIFPLKTTGMRWSIQSFQSFLSFCLCLAFGSVHLLRQWVYIEKVKCIPFFSICVIGCTPLNSNPTSGKWNFLKVFRQICKVFVNIFFCLLST